MQTIYTRLTPVAGGGTIQLPSADIERDGQGNLSLRFTDPIRSGSRLLADDLAPVLSTNVNVQRNRNMAVLAVTDPGGVLLDAEWVEYDPWAGARRGPFTMRCVAVLGSAVAAASEDRMTLVLYRTQFRYERSTGLLEGT